MEVDEGKMLFKLKTGKGSVSSFLGPDGVRHFPGDVVDLPASYQSMKWLETVAKEAKPVAAPSKVEPAEPVAVETSEPAPEPVAPKKKERKKSLSS